MGTGVATATRFMEGKILVVQTRFAQYRQTGDSGAAQNGNDPAVGKTGFPVSQPI